MTTQNALERLSSLTERQREVLRLRCSRMSANAIAEKLIISTQAVKNHLGNIYDKLDLREDEDGNPLSTTARAMILAQEYCPLLDDADLPLAPAPDPVEPDPDPELIELVEEEERALAIYEPTPRDPIIIIESQNDRVPPIDEQTRPKRLRWLLLGLLLGAALIIGIDYLALRTIPPDLLLLASGQPTPTITEITLPTSAPQEIEVTRVVIETQLAEIEVTREVLNEVTSTPDPNLPNSTPIIHTREVPVEVEVTREVILTSIPNPISIVITSTVGAQELEALSTQIATDFFATQTAEAPLLAGAVSEAVTPTATQSIADLGLPSGEWSVRSYRTDDRGVIVVNGHIVAASQYGNETDWININDFLHADKPNYATFISMNGRYGGTWGFELRQNDNIVWGNEGDSGERNSLNFVQTVHILPDDSVEEVNLRDFERELVGGVWSARVLAEDIGVLMINGVPVAGSYANLDFNWADVSSMLYADQDNEILALVWNFEGDYSWHFTLREEDTIVWGAENEGRAQLGEAFNKIIIVDGEGNVLP